MAILTTEGKMGGTAKHEEVEILLVEDDPLDLELTLRALQSDSIRNRIEVARGGEEALDFMFRRGALSGHSTETQPRLILLDLKVTKLHGPEVLRGIRAKPGTRP